ncbi:glycerate kinase [Leptospira selangorensis]|uniref:Glycerate kinase n=1 Tax=Leptospira selangorensis TaxID=2484982 RepID=A0A5F2C275_9LEPT|nr:glycerate kinase [Leptospira selangorensis]TGM12989.1 glycerate kinase [Leptospira selangorensis]TGM21259.1 glycerate kinase [Leptospira selangorensis]
MRYNRIIIAPDKFKGTLSATRAASAMYSGVRSALGDSIQVLKLPLADGGEGSLVALHSLRPKLNLCADILPNASGLNRSVCYLANETDAYFESARLLSLNFRDNRRLPLLDRRSSGLGRWVQHMLTQQKRNLFLFLGGTAVCDGGLGILQEFGFQLLDGKGNQVNSLRNLPNARRLVPPAVFTSIQANIKMFSDVTNPLLGPTGAPKLFGPQKGATPNDVALLEDGLAQLSLLWAEFAKQSDTNWPDGVGAGGGIALPFLGMARKQVTLNSGSLFFLEESGLADTIRPGDLILTGEGRTDAGTLAGKLVDAVVHLCRKVGADCLVISGAVADHDRLEAANYPKTIAVSSNGSVPSRKVAADELCKAVSRVFTGV